VRFPASAVDLYQWFNEEAESEGLHIQSFESRSPAFQIAWGKLFRRLRRENPERAENSQRTEARLTEVQSSAPVQDETEIGVETGQEQAL
jgi:hypothetical protein